MLTNEEKRKRGLIVRKLFDLPHQTVRVLEKSAKRSEMYLKPYVESLLIQIANNLQTDENKTN